MPHDFFFKFLRIRLAVSYFATTIEDVTVYFF